MVNAGKEKLTILWFKLQREEGLCWWCYFGEYKIGGCEDCASMRRKEKEGEGDDEELMNCRFQLNNPEKIHYTSPVRIYV